MMAPGSTPFRSLAIGTLAPGATIVVHFQPPLDLDVAYPTVITVNGRGQVTVLKTEPSEITLHNEAARHTPYWLVAVPRQLILAASTDWSRLFATLKERWLKGGSR